MTAPTRRRELFKKKLELDMIQSWANGLQITLNTAQGYGEMDEHLHSNSSNIILAIDFFFFITFAEPLCRHFNRHVCRVTMSHAVSDTHTQFDKRLQLNYKQVTFKPHKLKFSLDYGGNYWGNGAKDNFGLSEVKT